MAKFRVLLTDYAWPELDIERATLADIDAELVVAPAQDEAALRQLAENVDAIMTNWARVPAGVIGAGPRIRIVSRLGIGLDNIDVAFATEKRILVTNVPDYCLIEVAEHALALLLALSRKVAFYHQATKAGRYELQAGPPLRRIEGQTLGIIGLGNIGLRLAEKAAALGLNVIATTRTRREPPAGVRFVKFDELLAQSDYISLHLPLTPNTRHTIGQAQFERMKPSAYLINTARGGLVDTQALARALAQNRLAGAGLDVQDPEPPTLDTAPWNDPRVIVTPHAAFVSAESLENLRRRASRQVADCLTGLQPENVVNPQAFAHQARTS
jgi:D-3-phosphoglycerate dehydrogenase